MNPDFLLWHNAAHAPLERAVDEAAAAFARRTQLPPTQVVLPVGDWPATVGKLEVVVSEKLGRWFIEVHTVYQMGDVICSTCGAVMGHNPEITVGVSHSICESCKPIEWAKVEAWQLTLKLETTP